MFDLSAPETISDPYAAYRWLRDESPVHFWELEGHPLGGMWLVSRYEDVRSVLADDRCSKRGEAVGLDDPSPPILMFLDPPEHSRIRRPAVSAFTGRRVAKLGEVIAEDVNSLIEPIVAGDTVDVIEQVALPLPLHTICRLLGAPTSDAELLHGLTRRILDGTDAAGGLDESETVRADAELHAYMRELVESRRHDPSDDLLSALISPQGDAALSTEEAARMGTQLLVNGHETTVNLIGTSLFHLLHNRHEWERLVADPGMSAQAVEEALRFDAPNQRSSARFALEDLEFELGTVPAGSQVSAVIASANRDERKFGEPDVFDITRQPNPHLSFGHGRHHCPGSALTRAEVSQVLRQLARAAPDLELADPQPPYKPNSFDRGLMSLPVRRGRPKGG